MFGRQFLFVDPIPEAVPSMSVLGLVRGTAAPNSIAWNGIRDFPECLADGVMTSDADQKNLQASYGKFSRVTMPIDIDYRHLAIQNIECGPHII
jgi:hypothetical protein